MATWIILSFIDSASPNINQIIFFHDHLIITLILIVSIVIYIIVVLTKNKFNIINYPRRQKIEILWTISPVFILLIIAIPSLKILYMSDDLVNPSITIKSIGHQWYWSYEYSDFKNISFDSYLKPNKNERTFNLLDVDNRILLPFNTQIRNIISSADVIHSWTIPSLSLKLDAVPGRLNQISFNISRPGLFFGQCSEICGENHSFIPISIQSTRLKAFSSWLTNFSLISLIKSTSLLSFEIIALNY